MLIELFNKIIEPTKKNLADYKRRQAKFLAALAIILFFTGLPDVLLFSYFSEKSFKITQELIAQLIGIASLHFVYLLAKKGKVKTGISLLVIISTLIITFQSIRDTNFYSFICIPIILGSMFYSMSEIITQAVINITVTVLIAFFNINYPPRLVLIASLGYLFLVTVIILIAVYNQKIVEEAKQKLLKENNERLKQEIEERKKMEKDLISKVNQLQLIEDITVSREIKMLNLKKEIDLLKKQIQT